MQRPSINLDDPETIRLDDQGRSVAYFCRSNPVKVDNDLISQLKAAATRLGGNVRLCLHDGPDAPFHEMINLEHRSGYYRPHRHRVKGESYHIIEGTMGAFVFDENGVVQEANLLEPGNNFLYRIGIDMYHAVMPISDVLIYHESKPGPFIREGDSIFPDWAPDGSDPAEAAAYTEKLRQMLGVL